MKIAFKHLHLTREETENSEKKGRAIPKVSPLKEKSAVLKSYLKVLVFFIILLVTFKERGVDRATLRFKKYFLDREFDMELT